MFKGTAHGIFNKSMYVCSALILAGGVATVSMESVTGLTGVGDAIAAEQLAPTTATGIVVESMNAAGYTYLLVKGPLGDSWVAIPESNVEDGANVTYIQGMTMENFHSKTLDKTFEKIIFSEGLVEGAGSGEVVSKTQVKTGSNSFAQVVKEEQGKEAEAEVLEANPSGSGGAIVPKQTVDIEKAENGYTVLEMFSKAKDLDGKRVRVRGKVVKVNMNIMGKNWVHLQDGTGNPMKNSHDLVVTTNEEFVVDTIVELEGVVAAEKDFGSGYSYEVLLEEAIVMSK